MGSGNDQKTTDEDVAAVRARQVLEAYGARSENWPQSERAALQERIESDSALQALLVQEGALDSALARLSSVTAPATLAVRLLNDFDMEANGKRSHIWTRLRLVANALGHAVWPGAPLWQPMSALGVSLLLGLLLGVLLPAGQPTRDTEVRDSDVTVVSSPLDMSASPDSIELI